MSFIYKIMDSGWARTWFPLNFGIVIGVTWLITLGRGKIDLGVRDFNLRNSLFRKRGKSGVNRSLIYRVIEKDGRGLKPL